MMHRRFFTMYLILKEYKLIDHFGKYEANKDIYHVN